jgi:hypothetical protein
VDTVDRDGIVEAFIERANELDDADRQALAAARGASDEVFRAGAWRAAIDMVAGRATEYMRARARIGSAFVPDHLVELIRLGSQASPEDVVRWQEVARLTRAGLDDALLALLAADSIPPPDVRELYGPWKSMLGAAYERKNTQE